MGCDERHGVRGTVALNSDLCAEHPRIIERCGELGWELMGHNESNTRRLNSVPPEEEGGVVRRTVEVIAKAKRKKVKGWLSSGLSQTWKSLGISPTTASSMSPTGVNDDQPTR